MFIFEKNLKYKHGRMKKHLIPFKSFFSATLLSSLVLVGCVDDKYDLSKDVDMTVGVGEGLSIPIGSTEKIMLTELLDSAETDILKIDAEGEYSIFKAGDFSPESFEIGDMDIVIEPVGEKKHYDFELVDISDDYGNLPSWIQQEIQKQKYPYKVHQQIDYTTTFDIKQSVPEEMLKLRSLTFKDDTRMRIKVKIYSADHQSDDMLEIVDRLHLASDVHGGFLVDVPEYIVFEDESITQGHLLLNGDAVYNSSTQSLEYSCEYRLKALDFTGYKDGYLPVNDSKVAVHDVLGAIGYVDSDTVFFGYKNITHIQSVDVEVNFEIDRMVIETVEGVFAPEIEPIHETVDLDLGDDLDFLNDAYLDFNDPRIFVTFDNPVDARLLANAKFVGYDKSGNMLDGSEVETDMVFEGAVTNRIFINRYDSQLPGYKTLIVPGLNNLVKRIPDRVEVDVNARMDESGYTTVELGRSYDISGNYQVSVPLVFDEFNLVYTETVEDILGDDADDITDYVQDIESVTVSFVALNTIPAELIPSIIAYDEAGNRLHGIKVDVKGNITAGKGMDGGRVTDPVVSVVDLQLSSLNGELDRLANLDIRVGGKGSGRFNANEYIQLKDISVTINENIAVDLN